MFEQAVFIVSGKQGRKKFQDYRPASVDLFMGESMGIKPWPTARGFKPTPANSLKYLTIAQDSYAIDHRVERSEASRLELYFIHVFMPDGFIAIFCDGQVRQAIANHIERMVPLAVIQEDADYKGPTTDMVVGMHQEAKAQSLYPTFLQSVVTFAQPVPSQSGILGWLVGLIRE